MWTGPDHESYICLTVHWFAPDWQLQHALLDIFLCTDRHTGENLVEWIKQVLRANDICVGLHPAACCFANLLFPWLFFLSLLLQRLDAGALTHDHGADVTKAARLSGIHDFQCFDHELDLTVNAGLDCPTFAPIFLKASNMVSTIRSSNNLYRKLRDDQVGRHASWFYQTSSASCLYSWSCGQTTLYVLLFPRSLCALGGSPSMGCWNLCLPTRDRWEGCVQVMTILAVRCMSKTCQTQNGKSWRSVFVLQADHLQSPKAMVIWIGIIANFPALSGDLEAARGWELCGVLDLLGCSPWRGRGDCSSCRRFCSCCGPSTSNAWGSFQQESYFGAIAFQCFACFDDTAWPKVDDGAFLSLAAMLWFILFLVFLLSGGVYIVLWNSQMINGTE